MENNNIENNQTQKSENKRILIIFSIISLFIFFIFIFFSAPFNSVNNMIHISTGQSVDSLAHDLKEKNIISSEVIFKLFVKSLKSGTGIISGDYFIKQNSPVWMVALQVGRGIHEVKPIKITIMEGLTNIEIAELLSNKLINFNKEEFIFDTSEKQGYLFPDTYFLYPMDSEKDLIQKMSNNFLNKTKSITSKLGNKSLNDIVIMASILEGEAGGKDDIETISGILWKRISLGMPLQVDVDKSTYSNKGLPNKPLNNPGLSSINAALNPIDSKYLYYIHDKNGRVHYAISFDEHKKNIAQYLK